MTTSRLCKCLLFLLAGTSWGQTHEAWFDMGVSFLTNNGLGSTVAGGSPSDVSLGDNYRFGFRFAFAPIGHFEHEMQYGYTRTNLTDAGGVILTDSPTAGMAIHQWGYNLLYYVDSRGKEERIRPFATLGAHLSDFVLPGSAAYQGGSFRVGVNYGGGVKLRLSSIWNARFDFREYDSGKPNWQHVLVQQHGLIHQTEISAGLGVCF